MRLLLFSDLHCDEAAAESLVKQSAEVDVVVGAGDFATMRRGVEKTIERLKAIRCPTVIVPGNSESFEELTSACQGWDSVHVLHGSEVEVQGITFFGLGAAVPETPFGSWSYDLSEDDARQLLAACPDNAVLVTHSPPKGAVDISSSGASLGSVAVQEIIQQKSPRLVVCGHIHESGGKTDSLHATPVVNAGPRGIVWELGQRTSESEA